EIDASGAEKPQRQYYRDTGQGGSRGGFGGIDPNDIFAEILRQRGGGARAQGFAAPGQDHMFALEVSFLDAARGGTSRITLPGGEGLDVNIPAGLRDGQTLRLRGKGGEGLGGAPRGDALVTVTIATHPVFSRDGDDILVTLPITIDEAVLGAKVEAPTLHGPVGLTIPKGAKSGQVLRLRGRGIQRKGRDGDQLVALQIVTPKDSDGQLAAFLEDWRKTHREDPRAAMLKGMPL
ncbi:MAG: J domain-containing protein, partial [Deltaproteobacteria bacterium]